MHEREIFLVEVQLEPDDAEVCHIKQWIASRNILLKINILPEDCAGDGRMDGHDRLHGFVLG